MEDRRQSSPHFRLAILGIRGIPAHYGGFETCVDYSSRQLVNAGISVTVFNRSQHFQSHLTSYKGVKLRYVPRPKPTFLHTIGHTIRCAQQMRGDPFDLVHLYGVGNAFAIPLLKRGGRKLLISVDAEDWAREKWGIVGRNFLLASARFAVSQADGVIVDSQAIGTLYNQRFGANTHYIAYGAETMPAQGKEWLSKFGLASGNYHLFVGRLTPEKRPHLLVDAYRSVQSEMPLVLVGDDPYHTAYIAGMKANADERVRFVGTVYGDGFHQLCRHCYLYLTASAIEGTSPALLQAMGQGAAVLVNGIPANQETVADAGFTFLAGDKADLIRQWQQLIDQPTMVQNAKAKAVQRIQQYYNWEKVAKQLMVLYGTLLGL